MSIYSSIAEQNILIYALAAGVVEATFILNHADKGIVFADGQLSGTHTGSREAIAHEAVLAQIKLRQKLLHEERAFKGLQAHTVRVEPFDLELAQVLNTNTSKVSQALVHVEFSCEDGLSASVDMRTNIELTKVHMGLGVMVNAKLGLEEVMIGGRRVDYHNESIVLQLRDELADQTLQSLEETNHVLAGIFKR